MKKGVTITVLIFIAIVFFGALYYLYAKNQESPVVFETDKAEIKTIVKNKDLPAREIIKNIQNAAIEFCNGKPLHDDLTMIVAKSV